MPSILTDWQSQQYVEKLREACMRGYKAKIEGGAYGQGIAPYGYRVEGERRNSHLVVNEEQAHIVRWVFETYVYSGETTTAIARRLTEMGVPSPGDVLGRARKRERGIWTQSTLYKLLRQEAYAGTWYGQRYEKIQKKAGKKQFRQRPREEWVAVPVEPIISHQLWQEAQTKLNAKAFPRNQRHDYLMARRLTCRCGYAIRATTKHVGSSHERRYYTCFAYKNANGQCGLPGFQAELVEEAIWRWVEQLLKSPVALLEGYRQAQETVDKQHYHTKRQIDILDEQIQEYKVKLERLVDLYLDGTYPKDVLDVRKGEYTDITDQLSRQRDILAQQLEKALITENDITNIEAFVQKVRDRLDEIDELDFATKREVIEALNIRGTLTVEDNTKVLYLHWCLHNIRLPLESSNNDEGSEKSTPKSGSIYISGGIRSEPSQCQPISRRATASLAGCRSARWWWRQESEAARLSRSSSPLNRDATYSPFPVRSSARQASAPTGLSPMALRSAAAPNRFSTTSTSKPWLFSRR